MIFQDTHLVGKKPKIYSGILYVCTFVDETKPGLHFQISQRERSFSREGGRERERVKAI